MKFHLKTLHKNNQIKTLNKIFEDYNKDNFRLESNLKSFIETYELDEDVIRSLFNIMPKCWWNYIIKAQKLSEEFMREFKDKMDMNCATTQQIMSEDFIDEMKDKIPFKVIARYQTLSEDFIKKYWSELDWKYVSAHQHLSDEFIIENWDRINWGEYFYFNNRVNDLSEEFIFKHIDDIFADVNIRHKFFWMRTKALSPWLNKEFKKRYEE